MHTIHSTQQERFAAAWREALGLFRKMLGETYLEDLESSERPGGLCLFKLGASEIEIRLDESRVNLERIRLVTSGPIDLCGLRLYCRGEMRLSTSHDVHMNEDTHLGSALSQVQISARSVIMRRKTALRYSPASAETVL